MKRARLFFLSALVPFFLVAAPADKDKKVESAKPIAASLTKRVGKFAKFLTKGTDHEVQDITFEIIEKDSFPGLEARPQGKTFQWQDSRCPGQV